MVSNFATSRIDFRGNGLTPGLRSVAPLIPTPGPSPEVNCLDLCRAKTTTIAHDRTSEREDKAKNAAVYLSILYKKKADKV